MLPLTILLAHKMTRELAVARREGRMPWLHPSSHAIVAVDYRKNIDNALIPTRVHAVSIDTEHDHVASDLEIRSQILENIVKKVIPDHLIDDQTIFYINQKGHSGASGPQRHPGITGRKIIVDTVPPSQIRTPPWTKDCSNMPMVRITELT
jgi:S-adenosylmethionine synthetase